EGVEGVAFGVDQHLAEPGDAAERDEDGPFFGVRRRFGDRRSGGRLGGRAAARATGGSATASGERARGEHRCGEERDRAPAHVGSVSAPLTIAVAELIGATKVLPPAWTPIAGSWERSSAEESSASESPPQR